MFRPVLSVSRAWTGALFTQSTGTLTRGRSITKGPHIQPWTREGRRAPTPRGEVSDEGFELEDVENKIQRVINDEVKRQKTVKYHILRRQMTPRGPPERNLTWEAIEEIRYLKREQPEEWTVDRLAEGFSVSKDVIFRVLRSKFVPSPERKAKQDIQVEIKLKQQVLHSSTKVVQGKQRLSSGSTLAMPSSGNLKTAVVPMVHENPIPQIEQNPPAVVAKPLISEITEHFRDVPLKENHSTESNTEDEDWDGQVLTEENIEELMATVKSTPVVKEGDEFFDGDGNFLYRI